MTELTPQEKESLDALVPRADLAWAMRAGGTTPLLKMPREVFAWKETYVYFANVGLAGDMYIEVRGFDAPERKHIDPAELDWCIPLAYPNAPEVERLGWKVGFGEGWSDSMAIVRLRFGPEFGAFFAEVSKEKRLAIAEEGAAAASLLTQLDRNMKSIDRFTAW